MVWLMNNQLSLNNNLIKWLFDFMVLFGGHGDVQHSK